MLIALVLGAGSGAAASARALHVDDNASGDPGPGDPAVSDPFEDGSAAHPFDGIQEAIDAAEAGDVVIVAPGLYIERINFLGKAITVHGSAGAEQTIIDGGDAGTVVRFMNGETRDAVIEGFTIRNGDSFSWAAGVMCRGSSPTIRNNIITGNNGVASGGGIGSDFDANPLVLNNLISDNHAPGGGGGLFCWTAAAEIIGNTFAGNLASELDNGGGIRGVQATLVIRSNAFTGNRGSSGGAIAVHESAFTIVGNHITGNSSEFNGGGGAIALSSQAGGLVADNLIADNAASLAGGVWVVGASPMIRNNTIARNSGAGVLIEFESAATLAGNIIWENTLSVGADSIATVRFCDVQGGWSGPGNFSAPPQFVNASMGDYHIMPNSPCRNTGDPGYIAQPGESDIDGQIRLAEGRIDIGADELMHAGDATGDGAVDVDDLIAVILAWGSCANCATCAADFDGNCAVDVEDLITVILNWGERRERR